MTVENAHAIDIELCTECPFISEHTRDDKSTLCTHPSHPPFQQLYGHPFKAPPELCPIRHKLTVLRVTS